MNLFGKLYAIFRKDLLIKISYRFSFIYDFVSIFLKVIILYFISQFIFIDQEYSFPNNSYFSYAIFGLCFMDIMTSIVGSAPREIEDMKKTGVFEEIILLPIGNYAAILGTNIYQVFLSIIKVIIYFIFGSFISGTFLIDISNLLNFIFTLFLLLMSFVFISLIASSMSIWFARSSLIPALYITLSLILAEVYFPKDLLYDELSFFSAIFSLMPALENFRMFSDLNFETQIYFENIIHLIFLNLIYGVVSIYALKKSIQFSKSNGSFLHF